jgi:Phage tail tube protein
LIDSASFSRGTAGLSAFPAEPQIGQFDYSLVPGTLGQVWLGNNAAQFFTLTDARLRIVNNLQTRGGEFGSSYPLAFVAGRRQVTVDFTLVAQDDTQTTALYQTAKQRGTMSALLQLGQQRGEIMAIYLPSVTPQIPSFDDSGQRLVWHFANNKAGGEIENEIFVAFA